MITSFFLFPSFPYITFLPPFSFRIIYGCARFSRIPCTKWENPSSILNSVASASLQGWACTTLPEYCVSAMSSTLLCRVSISIFMFVVSLLHLQKPLIYLNSNSHFTSKIAITNPPMIRMY